ncbi:mitochondrial potassium channel ATP-binding subunit [Mesoplodon densirostris]|uniref:mitochondrial potassium channel ATP-binding subunit n=1 Tax=Mesoplodon densirostris TaxID=48708 RepID=UPI0028DB79A1|nr:mitochondrial potassium channel ATP-binding subunit [Mesoplodon densirostris]XP_059963994.1 mitochondrial potassium channel ATP-binding subunit [Mesoplodon densirostris]XP_059963995.1 mitochondrial potassium channel ATP-binding subunit [Mesoplodon densirostris]XP_059963996.1 mitochondrial potassium channel ATP-binding subunit [Mesoplodon densirostris]
MLVHLFRVGIRGSPVPGKPLLPLRFQTFSAVRSRDGRPSSCLLRAVARLQPQLRAFLPRAPPAPSRSPSAWLWVGGVLLGPMVLSKCPCRGLVALCEAEAAPPAHSGPSVVEPRFNWKLFWQFLRPHLLVLGAAIVLALGAALVNVQIPLLLGQLVEIVAKYTRDHVGSFLTESRNLSTHLLILYGLQGLLTFGYLVLLSRIGERMAADMRRALFSNLLRQDIAFFDAKKTGQLVSRLTTDVQEFKSSFKLVISQGLRSCTQVAGCLVSLSMLSTRLTLLLMVATPALMGAGTLMGSALRKLSRQCQEQVARATGVADEALGNVRTVRAFAMEQWEEERYGAELGGSRCKAEELGRGIALFQGLSSIAFNCMVLGTLFVGGSLVAGQQLTGGDLMSFLVASQTVQRSMANLSVLFGQVVRGLSAGTRVFEYMTLSPCIPLSGGHCIPREHLRGSITFHNVCFSYPCRPGFQVLRDFTLTLPPGKIVALVGQSGGGKTTVASLLERFYDPTAGMVTLDGQDLRTLDPSWLRGQVIGFISQEPVLFRTTIMENIRFGKPGASDDEVYAAAREANAHEFITSFPEGYDTVVGERGATLSGGQKQRLAIARALVKQPSVLILDEATSALDSESESLVQEALDRASAGRTVLVIAHRLSTVRGAHQIVVMAHGRVCEVGTHEELLKKGGLYLELIRRQALDAPPPETPRGPGKQHPKS